MSSHCSTSDAGASGSGSARSSSSSAVPLAAQAPPPPKQPRVLIIDHHDSYTLNLLPLLLRALELDVSDSATLASHVLVLPHTHPLLAPAVFATHLAPHIELLILSPGPGAPQHRRDFGAASDLLRSQHALPTLGVCLGHQGLATANGGAVRASAAPRHGTRSALQIVERDELELFDGVSQGTQVVRYNSLVVDEKTLPACLEVTAYATDAPNAASKAPNPSAHHALSAHALPAGELLCSAQTDASTLHERVILALRHRTLPQWGVQFHPESIESDGGVAMMRNFVRLGERQWARAAAGGCTEAAAHLQCWRQGTPLPPHLQALAGQCVARPPVLRLSRQRKAFHILERRLNCSALGAQDAPRVFDALFRRRDAAAVWLDSARPRNPANNFSYMSTPAFSVSYDVAQRCVSLRSNSRPDARAQVPLAAPSATEQTPAPSRTASPDFGPTTSSDAGPTFWAWLDAIHEELRSQTQAHVQPHFASGWAGYWGYEMGGEALHGVGSAAAAERSTGTETPPLDAHKMPDAHFGWCDAVLRFEHATGSWVASALVEDAQLPAEGAQLRSLQRALASMGLQQLGRTEAQAMSWFDEVQAQLDRLAGAAAEPTQLDAASTAPLSKLQARDSPALYKAKVEAARQHILHGESYELCLTTQFLGTLPPLTDAERDDSDHFPLYCALRKRNPAPYAAYILLAPAARGQRAQALLSTSPERFMSIDAGGNVEMKPIKGTLSRAGWADGEEELRGAASAQWREEEDGRRRRRLAADAKERAENLMIVDLIRADLLSFCAPASVQVPKLMQVETYETVLQLVTTVRGRIAAGTDAQARRTGSVEALQRCFPPGSMTGAPKRRSVRILEQLESERGAAAAAAAPAPRGPYAGALGWLDVGSGAASFSVVIRTVVANGDQLSLGAGGAVTFLSDAAREWAEVLDKAAALGVGRAA